MKSYYCLFILLFGIIGIAANLASLPNHTARRNGNAYGKRKKNCY